MAKAPETAMDAGEMKKLLVKSKQEPVHCAVALGGAQQAMLLLHKTKAARALANEIEKDHPDAKNTRWGSAVVDVDADPKLVIFTLNKTISGLGRKLTKTLKGTGFSKVEIRLEDGTVAEAAGEEEEAEGETAAASQPQAADSTEAESPETEAEEVDFTDLRSQLAGLIQRIPGAAGGDTGRMDTLKKLAGAANTAVKASDGPGAIKALAGLRQVIEGASSSQPTAPPTAPPPPPTEVPKGAFVAMQKSRLIWDATRKKVAADLDKFRDAVMEEMADDPEADEIVDALDELDEVLENLDTRLIDKLDEALSETDPQKHAALHAEAKTIIAQYIAYAGKDQLLKNLEGDTPFGKLSIATTVTTTLKALQTTLT